MAPPVLGSRCRSNVNSEVLSQAEKKVQVCSKILNWTVKLFFLELYTAEFFPKFLLQMHDDDL